MDFITGPGSARGSSLRESLDITPNADGAQILDKAPGCVLWV